MIRILIVDDHPAFEAGLMAVLHSEPGLVPVGAARDAEEMWGSLRRSRPDVVLLDYHVPPSDGLLLCRRIKQEMMPPRVLLFSAYASTGLVVPAILAKADGLLNKAAPARELFEAIRRVARGESLMPPVGPSQLEEACSRLDPADLPILGMALDDTPPAEIARTLHVDAHELAARTDRMIHRLRIDVPGTRSEADTTPRHGKR